MNLNSKKSNHIIAVDNRFSWTPLFEISFQIISSSRFRLTLYLIFAAVGSFILGNDRWSLVRSFDPSFASGNSQWKNLLYDALWPISSRVIRNWHVLAQQKIVLAQRKIACARSQLELSFLVDRSQDLRLKFSLSYLQSNISNGSTHFSMRTPSLNL